MAPLHPLESVAEAQLHKIRKERSPVGHVSLDALVDGVKDQGHHAHHSGTEDGGVAPETVRVRQVERVEAVGVRARVERVEVVGVRALVERVDAVGVRAGVERVEAVGIRARVERVEALGVRARVERVEAVRARARVERVEAVGVRARIERVEAVRVKAREEILEVEASPAPLGEHSASVSESLGITVSDGHTNHLRYRSKSFPRTLNLTSMRFSASSSNTWARGSRAM